MKISCLMITQPGRDKFAENAIKNFHAQDYPNKELIIINDPKDGTTLGELRNRSIVKATGDLVAIWDDDDISYPKRLSTQITELIDKKVDSVFLNLLTLRCSCGFECVSQLRTWECTMLAYKHCIPAYYNLNRKEDTAMVKKLLFTYPKHSTIDGTTLYTKTYHSDNASGREHNMHQFTLSTPRHFCNNLK